ncbi:MAG: prealbumin-like fold domain-containing protein [Peptoanaerobacter stomatis]
MALVLLISSISVPQSSYAEGTDSKPQDKSGILEPDITVKQDGDIRPGGNINLGYKDKDGNFIYKELSLNIKFKVPVRVENKDKYIKNGDYAEILIGKGLDLYKKGSVESELLNKPKDISADVVDSNNNKIKKNIGTAKFKKDKDDNVILRIDFAKDGDTFEKYKNISVEFGENFTINEKIINSGESGKDYVIDIYGKQYNVKQQDFLIVTKEHKEVNYNDKTITWTVKIENSKQDSEKELKGYEFFDDLLDIGDYVVGSFKVADKQQSPNNFKKENLKWTREPKKEEGKPKVRKLSYNFAEGDKTPLVIEFKTEIDDKDFYLKDNTKKLETITKTNTAFIRKGEEEYKAVGEVKIDKMWTQKKVIVKGQENSKPYRRGDSEKGEDPNSYYVDWTIEFNDQEKSLKNVKIKDKLPTDTLGECYLEFVHAKLEVWNKETKKYKVTDSNITPDSDSIYTIGNIDTKIKLTITTKINPNGINVDLEKTKRRDFKNVASVTWGKDGKLIVEHFAPMSIGETILSKKFAIENGSYIGQTITWNIKVYDYDKYSPKTSSYLYDMIIFKNSPDAIYKLEKEEEYKIFDSNGTEVTKLDGMDITNLSERKKIVPKFIRYNKYLEDSFNSDKTIKHKVYKIYVNDEYIGDLLEIYGFDPNKKDYNFTFKTMITDPLTLLGDGRITIANYVHLFEDKKQVAVSESWPEYNARMIIKQALPATVSRDLTEKLKEVQDVKDVEGLSDLVNKDVVDSNNKATDNKNVAFDKKTNSVIFRLSVNVSGMDNTIDEDGKNTGKSLIGDVILEDMLPDGWEFEDITEGNKFLIFEGTSYNPKEAYENIKNENQKRTRGVVKAENIVDDASGFLKAQFTNNKVEFTFTEIKKPYVILLKAGIKDLNAYKNKGEELMKNRAQVSIRDKSMKDSQDIKFKVDYPFITKKFDDKNIKNGNVTWTVEYNPDNKYNNKVTHIEDKLGKGLLLRRVPYTDDLNFENGNYIVEKGEFIYEEDATGQIERKFQFEKKYDETDVEELKKLIEYDDENEILKFNILEKDKAYRFIYVTDVDSSPSETLENTITLKGNDNGEIIKPIKEEYVVSTEYVKAHMDNRTADVNILKKDRDFPFTLKDAKFELIDEKNNIVSAGTTDIDGKLKFENLAEGYYILKEIKSPEGYRDNKESYKIRVKVLPYGNEAKLIGFYKNAEQDRTGNITIYNDKIDSVTPPLPPSTSDSMLIVSKDLKGKYADPNKEFTFNYEFSSSSTDTILFKSTRYKKDGTIVEVEDSILKNKGTFKLRGGENIGIEIPYETKYKLTEVDYKDEGYISTNSGNTDSTITTDKVILVSFTNEKITTSSQLRIEKRVEGNAAETTKLFDFAVKIGYDEGKEYKYEVKKINGDGTIVRQGNIKSGGAIQLAHEEYAVISDIELGSFYSVEETVSSSDGYTTTVNDVSSKTVSGDITENGTVVKFVNTRNNTTPGPGPGGSGGDDPTPPGPSNDPQTPPPSVPDRDRPTPSVPTYPIDDTPNPNNPASPDSIVVSDEDGVPLGTYTKQTKPDGTVEYVDEDGVPLGVRKLVKTGNEFPEIPLMMTSALSLLGLVVLRRYRRKDK